MLTKHYLSSLQSKNIIDNENIKRGEVIDTIIHIENLEPCGLVIKRSGFDNVTENIEPNDKLEQIIPVEFITEIGTTNVLLNTSFNKINTVLCDEIENKDEIIRFSQLKLLPVYNPNDRNIGKIRDLVFIDQVLIELDIKTEELESIHPNEPYPEGQICGLTIKEVDVSQVDIHIKISDKEIERRIKLSNDPTIYSFHLRPETDSIVTDRFKLRRTYLFN